ncbi:MAG: hypothetical protein IJW17_03450 [Lentisphaeria bacterium]|nr:hypothetical protein [Lentisphaeria bacterium]
MDKITLEFSLKPFCFDMSDEGFKRIAVKLFRQWEDLWKNTDTVFQLMFWTADGSELLDYSGNTEEAFEYARYLGSANGWLKVQQEKPQKCQTLHRLSRYFISEPPEWHYNDLKRLISILKNTALEMYGLHIEIGTTFDTGPEFAVSDFKYRRHPEILGNMLQSKSFIFCYAVLHADKRRYAGYPHGIPEGEPLGRFLGRQTKHFLTDMGFDFLWLSNGMGFGMDTWGMTGNTFDGENYFPENCRNTSDKIFQFWNSFREECPDFRIETRGTNLSTGLDLASDAVPLRDIYNNVPGLMPPPNSPWAAINDDFGLELAGMMSHIAELPPHNKYPYRYYTHDPWWLNSPWLDRYDRTPHDIYLPLAISRMDANGRVHGPSQLNILSVDNSFGEIPDQVPQEVIPHLLDAFRTAPDQSSPLVWVYPFRENHEQVLSGGDAPEVFANDFSIITAVNDGLPVSTVVSSTFLSGIPPEKFEGRILLVPANICDDAIVYLLDLKKTPIIFYGNIKNPLLLKHFGLQKTTPLTGEMIIPGKGKICHIERFSGGGVDLEPAPGSASEVVYNYVLGDESRPAMLYCGNTAYLRISNSIIRIRKNHGGQAEFSNPAEYFCTETLFREAAAHFNWSFQWDKPLAESASPRMMVHANDNAFYYSIFGTDMTVNGKCSTPDGAPVFRGVDYFLKENHAVFALPKFQHWEARIFVKGGDSIIRCRERTHENIGMERRLRIEGLKDAVLTIRPPRNCSIVAVTPVDGLFTMYDIPQRLEIRKEEDGFGVKYIAEHLNGGITIVMGNQLEEYFPPKPSYCK